MTIPEQIKEARHSSGYTQQHVAYLTGVTLRAYQRIEAGDRWPSYEYLLLLSSVLKTAFIIEEKI